jgi:hypothetical protein
MGVDAGLPSERFPFPAYPNGWAGVALGESLEPGDSERIRYFGRELEMRRRSSGEVDIVERASGRPWPTCERNGFVFLWYDGSGRPPGEEVPELSEHTDPAWSPYTRLRWKIRSRGYDMGENTVDDVHFHYLHGAASLPRTKAGDLMGTKSVDSKMKMESPLSDSPVEASIENTAVPGMGIVHLRGICDTLIVITSAPLDGEYVDQMFSYKQRTGGDAKLERVGKAFLRDLEKQMNEDIVCFEHKRYFLRPLLVEDDGAIADYRRRSRRRYTGDFPRPDDLPEWDDRVPPVPRLLSGPKDPPGFQERDFQELASFLRSRFRVRRVERSDDDAAGTVTLRLRGREDVVKHELVFERRCLDSHEVADLRAWLAKPLAKRRVEEAGSAPFLVPSVEIF